MRVANTDVKNNSNFLVSDYGETVYDIYYSMVELANSPIKSDDCKIDNIKKISRDNIKTFILGNMRYSREWVEKYKEIQKFDKVVEPDIDLNKHTVLIIISVDHFIYRRKVASLLNAIADKFDVNIIYKPHTRHEEIDLKIKAILNKNVKITYSYKCTTALMDMSDVVLLCGISSVGLHSVVGSKLIIFAEYISRYPTYYSRYMEEYTSMSEHDVLTKIENIFNKKMDFNKSDISDRIIKEVVNPNDSNDIIQDYFDLVCVIAKGSR